MTPTAQPGDPGRGRPSGGRTPLAYSRADFLANAAARHLHGRSVTSDMAAAREGVLMRQCSVCTMQHMARKSGDLTIRFDRTTRAKIDRLAEKRLGRKRSTGTFLKMLALSAVEREERASELRRMLRDLPPDPDAADEIARRRRED